MKRSFVGIVLISLLIGGISGGVFGVLAANGTLTDWAGMVIPSLKNKNTTQQIDTKTVALQEESATIDVVQKTAPAVVSIIESKAVPQVLNNSLSPFDLFFGTPQQTPQTSDNGTTKQQVASGSGFLISKDGYILTNKHVVPDDAAEYTVILNSGEEYTAKVLARHPVDDLAIVKIDDTKDFSFLELGDSDSSQIGQTVIAIGNALGQFQNTVTRGIISGLGRTITAGDGHGSYETLEDVMQTDAAINQGNSGGPLLNIGGQVIGVNTAVSTEGQLVGFTIPINQAKQAIESVQKSGKIVMPFLGVRYTIVDEQIKKLNDLPVAYGAIVVKGNTTDAIAVVPDSPADKAGIVENDIILEINGTRITKDDSLSHILAQYAPNETVSVKWLHEEKEKTADVQLGERGST